MLRSTIIIHNLPFLLPGTPVPDTFTWYHLQGLSDSWGMCIDAQGYGSTANTVIQMYNCHSTAATTWENQYWSYKAAPGGGANQ